MSNSLSGDGPINFKSFLLTSFAVRMSADNLLMSWGGGGIAQRLAHWLPVPAAPGSILGIPNNFELDFIDVAVI